jgi:Rieske Fe-S protein
MPKPGCKPSRRDFCLAGGATVLAIGCGSGDKHGKGDGGNDMSARAPADIAGFFQNPDFACGNQPAGGPFTSFAVGEAKFFRCARLFICRDAGGVYALTSICTHQQCDVEFDSSGPGFLCPCHLSQFDFNGNVTHDPATQPLVHFKVSLDGSGNVIVDPMTIVNPATRLNEPGD